MQNWLDGIWLTTIASNMPSVYKATFTITALSHAPHKKIEQRSLLTHWLYSPQCTANKVPVRTEYISLGLIHDGVWKLMSLLKVAWSFRSGIWSELQIGWGGMTHWLLQRVREGLYRACYNWSNEKVMQHLLFDAKQSNRIHSLHLLYPSFILYSQY